METRTEPTHCTYRKPGRKVRVASAWGEAPTYAPVPMWAREVCGKPGKVDGTGECRCTSHRGRKNEEGRVTTRVNPYR